MDTKRIVAALCRAVAVAFGFAATALAGGMEDKVLRFSTPGPDCYADGSIVADGECYALVWSPAGGAFAGFNADGTTVSPDDRVVYAAPLALNGKCRTTLFQIPAEEYAALEGGVWSVCLVDTRRADGTPAGLEGNAPVRVNRWTTVEKAAQVSGASSTALAAAVRKTRLLKAASSGEEADGAGFTVDAVSAIPAGTPQPRITSFTVVDGEVRIGVEGTVPWLTYTIESGESPAKLGADPTATRVDGDGAAEIEIGAAADASCRFFKVGRAEF